MKHYLPKNAEDASALILTLLVIVLLSAIVTSFLSTSRTEQTATRNNAGKAQAEMLVASATQQAMVNLQSAFNANGTVAGSYAAVVTSQPGGITKYFFQNGTCSSNGTVALFFTSSSANANGTLNMNNLDNSTTSALSGLITGNGNEVITVAQVNVLDGSSNQTIGRIAYYIDDESTKINLNSLAGNRSTLNAGYGKAQSLKGVDSSIFVNGSARFSGNLSFVDSIVNGLASNSSNSITTWTSFFRPEQAQSASSFGINATQIKHYSAAPLSDFHLKYTPWGTQRLFINDEPTTDTGVSNIYSALTGLNASTQNVSTSPAYYEINGIMLRHIFNGTFSDKYSSNGTKQIAANMLQLRDKNTTGWNGIYFNGGLIGSGNLSSTGIPHSYLGYIPPAAINEVAIQPEKDESNGTLNICVYVELWAPMWDYGAANFALNVNLQSATFSSGNITLTFPNQSLSQNVTLQTYGRYVQRFVFSQPATSFNGTLNIAMGDIKLLASQSNASSIRDWITGSVINSLLPINTTINSTQTVNYTASSPWNTSQNMTSIQRKDIRIRQDSSGVYSLSKNSVTNPWLVQKHTFPPVINTSQDYNFIQSYAGTPNNGDYSDNHINGGFPNWVLEDPYVDYSSWPADHTCQGSNLPWFRFYNNNRYLYPLLFATDMNGDGLYIWPADLGKVMTDKMYRTLRMWWQPPEERALGFIPDWALLDLVSFSSNNSAKFPLKIAPMNLNGVFNSLSATPPRPRNNLQCLTISYDFSNGNVTSSVANSNNRTYYNSIPPRGRLDWLGAGAGVSLALTSNLTQHITSANSTIAWSKITGNKTWSFYRNSKGWPTRQIVIPCEISEIKSVADYTVTPNADPALRPYAWYYNLANSEVNENRLAAFFPGLTFCSNFFTIYAYAQALDKSGNIDSEALTKTLVEVEITTPATATSGAVYKVKKLYTETIPMDQ